MGDLDRTKLETYLSDVEFEEIFKMSKDDFYNLQTWKQLRLKRQNKLD